MVEIKGILKCNKCKWEDENVDTMFICPNCKGNNITHIPPHKIFLCKKNNPEGYGRNGGKLGNIHKKILINQRNKSETYFEILKLIRSERREWSSVEIIDHFGVGSLTDGDVVRMILDLLVCQGYLEKKFMFGKKFHLYNSNVEKIIPCPYLIKRNKGKNIGLYRCDFDFKMFGEEIDSFKVFNKQREDKDGNKD